MQREGEAVAKRTTFTVEKSTDGWKAVQRGRGTVAEGALKADVVGQTVRLARAEDSASIKIKGRQGTIQEERTYPLGRSAWNERITRHE